MFIGLLKSSLRKTIKKPTNIKQKLFVDIWVQINGLKYNYLGNRNQYE